MEPNKTITFGELIFRLRKANMLVQEELAHNCKFSRKYMSNLELDKTKPNYERTVTLAKNLNVKPSELFHKLGEMADRENGIK